MKVPLDPDLLIAELEIMQHRAVSIQSQLKSLAIDAANLGDKTYELIKAIENAPEKTRGKCPLCGDEHTVREI